MGFIKSTRVSWRDQRGVYLATNGTTKEASGFAELLEAGATRGVAASPERWGYDPEPGMLYVAVRAISSRINANYDGWPASELEQSWDSFIGRGVYVEHHNWDSDRTRGVILDAKLHRDKLAGGIKDYWVELLIEVDAKTFPRLAKAIIDGEVNAVSMGADVEYTICTVCGNRAANVLEYCDHVARKGQKFQTDEGHQVIAAELCHGVNFFEISFVFDPADESAFISDYYQAEGLAATATKLRKHDEDVGKYRRRLKKAATKKQALDGVAVPEEVDTLREEQICPSCGQEYDGEICDNCGYENPPEGLQDPDTEPRGDAAERRDRAVEEFGDTGGEPVPLDDFEQGEGGGGTSAPPPSAPGGMPSAEPPAGGEEPGAPGAPGEEAGEGPTPEGEPPEGAEPQGESVGPSPVPERTPRSPADVAGPGAGEGPGEAPEGEGPGEAGEDVDVERVEEDYGVTIPHEQVQYYRENRGKPYKDWNPAPDAPPIEPPEDKGEEREEKRRRPKDKKKRRRRRPRRPRQRTRSVKEAERVELVCNECGNKFKKNIGPNTVEAQCPQCRGYDTEPAFFARKRAAKFTTFKSDLKEALAGIEGGDVLLQALEVNDDGGDYYMADWHESVQSMMEPLANLGYEVTHLGQALDRFFERHKDAKVSTSSAPDANVSFTSTNGSSSSGDVSYSVTYSQTTEERKTEQDAETKIDLETEYEEGYDRGYEHGYMGSQHVVEMTGGSAINPGGAWERGYYVGYIDGTEDRESEAREGKSNGVVAQAAEYGVRIVFDEAKPESGQEVLNVTNELSINGKVYQNREEVYVDNVDEVEAEEIAAEFGNRATVVPGSFISGWLDNFATPITSKTGSLELLKAERLIKKILATDDLDTAISLVWEAMNTLDAATEDFVSRERRREIEDAHDLLADVASLYSPDLDIAKDHAEAALRVMKGQRGAKTAAVQVHEFGSTNEAYGRSQTDDSIQDGDVLAIPSEGVYGLLYQAWPVAVTENTGDLHPIVDKAAFLADFPEYVEAWEQAENLARGASRTGKDYSQEKRDEFADKGWALEDGSFPIADCGDVEDAVNRAHQANDPEKARNHIKKRWRELNCEGQVTEPFTSASNRGKKREPKESSTESDKRGTGMTRDELRKKARERHARRLRQRGSSEEKKVNTKQRPTRRTANKSEDEDRRQKLREKARREALRRARARRQAKQEKEAAPTDEQVRNEPETRDVETEEDNVQQQTQKADHPDDVNDSGQTDHAPVSKDPLEGTDGTDATELEGENTNLPAPQGNKDEGAEDKEAAAEAEENAEDEKDERAEKKAESKKQAHLLRVFSFVEEREKLGLSKRAERLKQIDRFENMDSERFEGFVEATKEFKQSMDEGQARRVAVRRNEDGDGDDDTQQRSAGRFPGLGQRSAGSAGDSDESVTDELTFL